MSALQQRLDGIGPLFARDAPQPALVRLQVDEPEQPAEVQHRGKDARERDLGVGDAGMRGHDERRRAEDGRHDLPAVRGQRLDRPRDARPVAELLHQRDGELAGGIDVGDGRAGHRSDEAGGEHRHLRRPSARVAGDAVGEPDEEVGRTGTLGERAEDDEQHDVRGRDPQRHAPDAVVGQVHVVEHVLEAESAVGEVPDRDVLAEVGIGERAHGDDHEQPSHDPAGDLQQHHDGEDPERDLVGLHRIGAGHGPALGQVSAVDEHVPERRDRDEDQHPVVERHSLRRPGPLAREPLGPRDAHRQQREHRRRQQGDRSLDVGEERAHVGGVDVEEGETDRQSSDDEQRESVHEAPSPESASIGTGIMLRYAPNLDPLNFEWRHCCPGVADCYESIIC